VSWSLEEVREAEERLTRIWSLLTPPVRQPDLIECVTDLYELVKKLIADKKNEAEHAELVEHMDENGD
jgi:hypothetical protein